MSPAKALKAELEKNADEIKRLRKELEQARIRLEKAAGYMPDAPAVHYQLGILYRRLGQLEKAQEHLRLSKQP